MKIFASLTALVVQWLLKILCHDIIGKFFNWTIAYRWYGERRISIKQGDTYAVLPVWKEPLHFFLLICDWALYIMNILNISAASSPRLNYSRAVLESSGVFCRSDDVMTLASRSSQPIRGWLNSEEVIVAALSSLVVLELHARQQVQSALEYMLSNCLSNWSLLTLDGVYG